MRVSGKEGGMTGEGCACCRRLEAENLILREEVDYLRGFETNEVETFRPHLDLYPTCVRILRILARTPDPLSSEALLARVWDDPAEASSDALRVHMYRIRIALGKDAVPDTDFATRRKQLAGCWV